MTEPEIVPLSLDDIRPNLPQLPEGECWDISAEYSPAFFDRSGKVYVRVSITSADGFYSQSWWERLRGVAPSERQKTWCYSSEALSPTGVTRESVANAVYRLVDVVYATRNGQRVIDGFDGRLC